MKLFLQRSIIFGFIINIVIVLVLGWVLYKREQNYTDIHNLETNHIGVVKGVEKSLSFVSSFESNAKGYVFTGNEKYLEIFNDNVYETRKAVENLTDLFKNNEKQLQRVGQLDLLIGEKIDYNDQFIETTKYKSIDAAKSILPADRDIQITDQIDQITFQMLQEENSSFEVEKVKKVDLQEDLIIVSSVLFISIIFLLSVVLFVVLYNRKIRKQTELLFQENKHLLQSFFDNTTNYIIIKELTGEYLLVNKQVESFFHSTNQQLKGKTDYQFFSKEIADDLRSKEMEMIKAGKEIIFQVQVPRDDGLHVYRVVKFPISDAGEKIYATGEIATDITESEKINILVRESEEELKTLLQAGPDAVIVINEESNIIQWNAQAESLFGWSKDEIIGKPVHEILMPSHYRTLYLNGIQHFLETGEGNLLNRSVEVTALKKDSIQFDIEITVSFIKMQSENMFIIFAKDITKRKQLEKETRQATVFLNSIVENVPNMILVKDAKELRFVRFNKAGEDLLGYSRSDLVGKNDHDLFSKEQADFFTKKDKEALSSQSPIDIEEEEIDTKNGKRWLHTKRIPLIDDNGQSIYLLSISEDITEKKKLQDEHDKAEKLLRENEKRVMLILDNISEGIIVVDDHHKVLLANLTAEESWRIKEGNDEAFDWSNYYELFYPNSSTIFPAQDFPLEKALKGESTDEVEIVLYDPVLQENRIVEVTGRPIRDESNKIISAVATVREITKYVIMKKALEESEKRNRNAIGFKVGNA